MSQRTVLLVDHQNVRDDGLKKLPANHQRILLFVGKNDKPKEDFIHDAMKRDVRVDLIPIKEHGDNNLDFHLAFYFGRVLAEEPDAEFIVVSNDGDFDKLLKHVESLGIPCSRHKTRETKPAAKTPAQKQKTPAPAPVAKVPPAPQKPPAPKTAEKRAATKTATVREARELLDAEKHPPKTKDKLRHRLERHFAIATLQAEALIGMLEKEGFIQVEAKGKVNYLKKKAP